MERRERERILAEGGVRGETVREARQRAALEHDLDGSPLKGGPLRQRLRNATPAADNYIVSLGGPLPYMQRLRMIEDETAEHERRLERAWRELAAESDGDADAFARTWVSVAERWLFTAVNELVDRHNRYYPAEARLPMDPRTGDFALVHGRRYERERLGSAWVLERFPPLLAAAQVSEAA